MINDFIFGAIRPDFIAIQTLYSGKKIIPDNESKTHNIKKFFKTRITFSTLTAIFVINTV